jgi:hypothetical protein
MKQEPLDGLSLTKSGRMRNKVTRQNKGKIIFDPSITCRESLAKCFRIFTDPARTTNHPAKHYKHQGPISQCTMELAKVTLCP